MDENVAVFDLGSARAKLIIAEKRPDNTIAFRRFKEETGVAIEFSAADDLPLEAEACIRAAVERLCRLAKQHHCRFSVAVATEVFRKAKNGEEVLARLGSLLGSIAVLDPLIEGGIFYSAMSRLLGAEVLAGDRLCVVDVGGGSVQAAWGTSASDIVSLPTGTFRLEAMFQPDKREPTEESLHQMEEYVGRTVRASVPSINCLNLVFGSNCMLDFVSSMCAAVGLEYRTVASNSEVHAVAGIELIEEMLSLVAGKPYESVASYFPSNPYFMRGADKALINVVAMAKRVDARRVIPTNESIGSALARLLITDPEALTELGVPVTACV